MKRLGLPCGLVLVSTLLASCALPVKPQSPPLVQFQGSVELWDNETVDYCKIMAVTVVSEAMKLTKEPTPAPSVLEKALEDVYGECLAANGRTI